MAQEEPPKTAIEPSGFPTHDLWEESGAAWERLYAHGLDRHIVDLNFKRARELGADRLSLTDEVIRRTLVTLQLAAEDEDWLTNKLFCLAGQYYSPRFHKLFEDDPRSAKSHFRSIAGTAAKLQKLISKLSFSMDRQFHAVRLQLHSRRSIPRPAFLDRSSLAAELADLEAAANTAAREIPVLSQGSNPRILQGRWLRHAAEAIERVTRRKIKTKSNDTAGKNYRLVGSDGEALRAYARAVEPKNRDGNAHQRRQRISRVRDCRRPRSRSRENIICDTCQRGSRELIVPSKGGIQCQSSGGHLSGASCR